MNGVLQDLLELQTLEFDEAIGSKTERRIALLRTKIPKPVLSQYDHMADSGKIGVVMLHHQVCTGCHLQVPLHVVLDLRPGDELRLCENCRRYLYLPEESQCSLWPQPKTPSNPACGSRSMPVKIPVPTQLPFAAENRTIWFQTVFGSLQMKPRVILDIGFLGHAHDARSARRGAQRVAGHLFDGLLASGQYDLSYVATSHVAGAFDFLAAQNISPSEQLRHGPWRVHSSRLARQLSAVIQGSIENRSLPARAGRRILASFSSQEVDENREGSRTLRGGERSPIAAFPTSGVQ